MNAFIFHGLGGSAEENWFPWLQIELQNNGIPCTVPNFPGAALPRQSIWLGHLEQYQEQINADTILIGHSLGCALILRYLEVTGTSVRACHLVAPACTPLSHPVDLLIHDFTHAPFNWSRICSCCQSITVYESDNDPYIPQASSQTVAQFLGATVCTIPNGGHINQGSGFLTFPLLFECISREINRIT